MAASPTLPPHSPGTASRSRCSGSANGGSAHSLGFALYSYAAGRYEDAILLTGSPVGTPQEALDPACTLYLVGPDGEPGLGPLTNLQS